MTIRYTDVMHDARISMRNFIKRIETLINEHTTDKSSLYLSDRIITIARKYVTLKAKEYIIKNNPPSTLKWSASWTSLGVPDSYFNCELTFHTTNFGTEQVVVHVWVIAAEVIESCLEDIDLSRELSTGFTDDDDLYSENDS